MTPPKPPRTNYMMKSTITSSYVCPQPAYEDPDASMPAIIDGGRSEVKVKPVPRPRSKLQPKVQSNTNNTVDSVDKTSNTTNGVGPQYYEYPIDYGRPCPVRPPPKPPITKCLTSSKPTAACEGGSQHMSSNTEPDMKAPAVSTERTLNLSPPRPERPSPPSVYYDRPPSAMGIRSKNLTEESQQSTISSMRQTPVSPACSDEVVSLCGSYSEMSIDSTDRPAVPPRFRRPSLSCSASVYETSPLQSRPPPPLFNPPPPPSTGTPLESVYSETESRHYLDVLPEDENEMTQGRSMTCSRLRYQSSSFSSHLQTTEDTEDIKGMLRWLKRVSKSDFMSPSVYGVSIEEEIRSFNQRAMNVSKALRLYNLLMMKRGELLRNVITEFSSISKSLDKMQKTTKTMGIAGGTTGAVGGVTAVVGIALAPMTMGVSLIATAVGAGMVASAGGLGAHSVKTNKKTVNRIKVEELVNEYKANVVDLEHCLDFILSGMNELRRFDIARLQRAGALPDALKMAHLSQSVFRNNLNHGRSSSVSHTGGMSSERLLMAFVKEMDQYFTENNGQKLKKSKKSRFSGRVRLLAENLQDDLEYLNRMWEMFS